MTRKMKKFYKKKLDNGLTILFEKRKNQVVSTALAVKQGFAFEEEERKGVSHFLEHLTHKGTRNRTSKQITEEIEKRGGVINAYTGEEETVFWNKLPKEHFLKGADVCSDIVFNPLLKKEDFDKEKKVILEEIKMYKDTPKYYILDKIKNLLYERPFGMSGLGTLKGVQNLSRKQLLREYRKKYKTDQMLFAVVGNTSLKEIEKIGKKFPKNKGRKNRLKLKKINKKLVEKRKGISQAGLALGMHVSNLKEKKRYCWDVFDAVFAKGMSSRLFEEIREKRGLAYDVGSYLERGKNFGYYVIYVGTTKENVEKCKKTILKEIDSMKQVTSKEVKEAKKQLIGFRKVGSEESINVLRGLIDEEVAGNAEDFYNYEKNIKKVKLKDVKKLKFKDYSCFTLLPDNY